MTTGNPEVSEQSATSVWRVLGQLPGYCQLLIVGVAVNRMASFVQVFIVLYLTLQLHWSAAAAGVTLTLFGAGSVAGVSAAGVVTDRLGCRNTIVLSMIGAGVSTSVLAGVTDRPTVNLVCIAAGMSTQLFRPAAMTLLGGAVDAQQLVLVAAGYRLGVNAGALVTPLLGAALVAHSYTLLLCVDAAASLLFGLLALLTLPARRAVPERDEPEPEARTGGIDRVRPLRDPRLLFLMVGMLLIASVEIQYVAALPLEVVRQGLPVSLYAVLITANGLLVVALEPTLTGLLRNWPIARSLPLGVLLIGVGIAAYGVHGGAGMLIVATLIWTLGEMIGAPPAAAFPAMMAPKVARARYLALAGGAQSAGYAIGPSIGTLLYAADQRLLWVCCVIGGCLAACCCAVSGRRADAPPEQLPARAPVDQIGVLFRRRRQDAARR